ncbi:MAG: hypothetical protein ACYC2E_05415 [Sulfuricella sp.]
MLHFIGVGGSSSSGKFPNEIVKIPDTLNVMLRAYQEPRHHPHNTRSPSGSQISIGIQAQGNGEIRAQGSVHMDGKQRTVEDWLGEQGQAAFGQGGEDLLAVDCKIFRHRIKGAQVPMALT